MRYGPTISMVGTPFSISPSYLGFPLHFCQSAAGPGGAVGTETRQAPLPSILSDNGGSVAQNAGVGTTGRAKVRDGLPVRVTLATFR